MSEKIETLIENCSLLLSSGRQGGEELTLREGGVALADGRIRAVGGTRELRDRFRARERLEGGGRLLTPGFVDSHTHALFAGDRSGEFLSRCAGATYEQISAAGGGIRSTVRATRAASEDELVAATLPRVRRMLAGGSTTIEIKSGYGLDTESELRMLRAIRRVGDSVEARIVPTFCGAHDFPDEFRADHDGFVDLVCEQMVPRVAEQGLARFCDVFCEENFFTPEQSRRILEAGKRAGLSAKIHADELANSGGARVASQVGAVSADHLMMASDADLDALGAAGVVATLLPGTTFYLRKSRYAPARRMLEKRLPVALATDRNPGSCTVESMLMIVGLATLHLGMSWGEAFRAATQVGARALGLAGETGALEEGLAADLILWEASHPAQVVAEFANEVPRTVFVAGRRVMQ